MLRISAIAIVFLLCGISSLFVLWHSEKVAAQGGEAYKEYVVEVPPGAKSKITFPDGSSAWLNAGSKVRYNSNFGKNSRHIELCGEGYFEVSKNKELPFVVSTEKLTVQVLGTKFNLKSYEEDSEVKVTLKEGAVAVGKLQVDVTPVILEPNQQLTYGARAANGVILITTKQGAGNGQKVTIGYHGNVGFYSPTKMYDVVINSVEFMELSNIAKINSGRSDLYSQEIIDQYKQNAGSEQFPSFDWLGYMFRTAVVQTHNLSVAGSTDKTTYNLVLNYVNQPGTMRGFDYQKYNVMLDLTSQINKFIKVGAYSNMMYGDREEPRQGQGDAFLSTLAQAPTYKPWLPADGSGITRWTASAYSFENHNKNMPAIIGTNTMKNYQNFDINTQLWLEVSPVKGLTWFTKGAARLQSNKSKDWRGMTEPIYLYHSGEQMGTLDKGGLGLTERDERRFYTNLYTYLKYEYSTPDKNHNFALIAGVEDYSFNKSDLTMSYHQTAYANRSIKWESTAITNIGIDLMLLNRLNFTFEWYNKVTDNILRSSQVSDLLGLSAPTVNNGKVQNRGIELSMGWNDMIMEGAMKGFQYNIGFNISHNKNELKEFGKVEYGDYGIRQEGLPYGEYYMLECIGVFADQNEIDNSPKQFNDNIQPGDLKYLDWNKNGKVDNDDRHPVSGRFPACDYAVTADASWKGFDLSFIGQGVANVKYYTTYFGAHPFAQGGAVRKDYIEEMWTPENPYGAKNPRLYYDNMGGTKNTRDNTYFLRNASYFRLKNLTFGYTIPRRITEKASISRLRVYFSGDNLFTITPYKGLDPERNGNGWEATYPQNRICSFGVNVEF